MYNIIQSKKYNQQKKIMSLVMEFVLKIIVFYSVYCRHCFISAALFQRFLSQLIIDKPEDPIQFAIEWLKKDHHQGSYML